MPVPTNTLDMIEERIPRLTASNPRVSAWSVGQQLHHVLLATNGIARALTDSVPGARRPDFNPLRWAVLLAGDFPRGRGRAPKNAWPSDDVTEGELRGLLASGRDALDRAARAHPHAWWRHFAFGVMRRDAAIRFLHIHNRHHLKIVDEILERS